MLSSGQASTKQNPFDNPTYSTPQEYISPVTIGKATFDEDYYIYLATEEGRTNANTYFSDSAKKTGETSKDHSYITPLKEDAEALYSNPITANQIPETHYITQGHGYQGLIISTVNYLSIYSSIQKDQDNLTTTGKNIQELSKHVRLPVNTNEHVYVNVKRSGVF